MIQFLIVTLSLLTATAFGWSLHHLLGVDISMAALSGGVFFLIALQLRNGALRAKLAREVAEDMEDLREANAAIKNTLDDTKKKMADVTLALAKRTDAQEKKMVGELQIIENLVREFAASTARKTLPQTNEVLDLKAQDVIGSVPQGFTDPAMLDIIRNALEENRVDLYLQPMVSLPQRKVRFYEALSRLRSDDGAIIMPAQYIRIAAPAGLMSIVDNLLLFRCVQVVKRLTQKHRDVGVFCNISGHTLRDAAFFPQFLDFLRQHRELTGQIVFEFGQDAVLAARGPEEKNLRALAELGFRLSMDQVTKLDVDFGRVKRLGFQFLKVRADTLISGMRDANAAVAAEDFKALLSRNGLDLIVERVEDEKSLVQLLEYNVDFGQGFLFGEPKAIREVSEANDPRAPLPSAANATLFSVDLARRLAG